jgi:hypothetical protein
MQLLFGRYGDGQKVAANTVTSAIQHLSDESRFPHAAVTELGDDLVRQLCSVGSDGGAAIGRLCRFC